MSLTDKRHKFVEAYVGPARLNATKAALLAGYAESGAGTEGSRLLQNAAVRDAIAKRLKEFSISTEEATERMAGWSRGGFGAFLDEEGYIDLTTPEAQANLHLIKKIKRSHNKYGENIELELHDPKDANKEILKMRGAYQEPDVGEFKFLIVRSLDEVEPSRP